MGQRTKFIQIIRSHIESESIQPATSVKLFHNQWGFGKVMPLALIGELTKLYHHRRDLPKTQAEVGALISNLHFNASDSNFIDEYAEIPSNAESAKSHQKWVELSVKELSAILGMTVHEIPAYLYDMGMDNNDGYMVQVIDILPSEGNYTVLLETRVIFVANEYHKKAGKILSAKEYMRMYYKAGVGNDPYSIKNVETALYALYDLFCNGGEHIDIGEQLKAKDYDLTTYKPFEIKPKP